MQQPGQPPFLAGGQPVPVMMRVMVLGDDAARDAGRNYITIASEFLGQEA